MSTWAKNPPRHVAIIMDGNGRWATRRGRPRVYGHVRGAARVKQIVETAHDLGIQALTLYAFSTENWSRPQAELDVLWRLLRKFLFKERNNLKKKNVRLQVIGELHRLSPELQEIVSDSIQMLEKNTGLLLTLAVSYGSRSEIIQAAQKFSQDCIEGKRNPEDLTEKDFESYLWTAPDRQLAEVDLVIRTSGEKRISNFLLWQSAYAEYRFTDVCWPDFSPRDLSEAVDDYCGRERRFGRIKTDPLRDVLRVKATL